MDRRSMTGAQYRPVCFEDDRDSSWAVTDCGCLEFDKLNRQVAKLVQAGNTPKIYIRTIAELEDFMNESIAKQKVSTRKMNATNARGLNAVKQRIKKNNKDYQKDIDAYNADKEGFMESEEEEEPVPRRVTKKAKAEDGDFAGLDVDDEGFSTVGKGGRTLQFTPESILKHLRTIMESRGKKNTDRMEQIKIMEKLLAVAVTPYQRVRVLLTLISTRFDLSTGAQTFMPQDQWKSAEQEFANLLTVLEANPDLVIVENAEEWEDDDKPPTITPGQRFKIPGSVVSFAERLDDELTRSLQHIDPHTAEYIDRLSDEGALYNNIVRSLLYIEQLSKDTTLQVPQDGLNRVVMRRLEHVYFKVSTSQLPTKCLF
jgi:translation initiation factor 3 subunit C